MEILFVEKNRYPRFFQTQFDIVFIKRKGGKVLTKSSFSGVFTEFYSEATANSFVKDKRWKEIPKAEAAFYL